MEVGVVCQVRPVVHLEKMHVRLQEKYPDVDLLSQIKKRLEALAEPIQLNTTTTQAIAVCLQCPAHLDGLQEKDPAFQAWKRASYEFLCQEFGKENLVYVHLNQDKSIAAIHCIFVPIQFNLLIPQAFVGTIAQQQGYVDRYQAVLDRLFKQDLHTIKRMDLLEYLIEAHDYQKNNRKSSVKWPRVDHRDGTKLLLHQNKGIHYYQSLNDEQDKGTIVDYLLGRGCKDQKEVLAQVLGGYLSKQEYVRLNQERPSSEGEQRSDEPSRDPAFYQREAQSEFNKSCKLYYGETYLESRGIEPATYQRIQGIKANFLGAIFCLYTEVDTQGQGKLCSTIKYFSGEEGE
jgi:transcription elongation factor Elf1